MTLLIATSARRRATEAPVAVDPPTLTFTAAASTLVSDGTYNSFPGAVTCPNGDILAAYRTGTNHTQGGNLYTIRSVDNGATWGTPQLIAAATATQAYGTATLSVIDGDRIALTTWTRHPSGIAPAGHSARILISDDDGASWGTPVPVDLGSEWLGTFSVTESPLVHWRGYYYLGVWGVNAGVPSNYYSAGVARSADLVTWEQLATFDSLAQNGFNECGIANMGASLVCLIRHEGIGRFVSTTTDGASWSFREQVSEGKTGAPKMAHDRMLGVNTVPLRVSHPSDGPGAGLMACVDPVGNYTNLGTLLNDGSKFMYGQVCRITETSGLVIYCAETAPNVANLHSRPFTLTAP